MNPTVSEDQTLVAKAGVWKKVLWISVGGIILPPVLGLGSTVVNMIQAFQKVGATATGDPQTLAESVSTSMNTTAIGLIISLAFGILLIVSLVRLAHLKRLQARARQR